MWAKTGQPFRKIAILFQQSHFSATIGNIISINMKGKSARAAPLVPRPRKTRRTATEDLAVALSRKVVGQPAATKVIVPYIQMYQAGLAPAGRPVGVFLLLGPTGTGKTKTIEALAEILHGSSGKLLKVDCGEFQMEHEVAKLTGAPPGYLGHRDTQPALSQEKLAAVTSDKSNLSLVLFDEIEKAAPSVARLLLGVLDKGQLRLGDNSLVNFENSLVFLTSNLGAREMMRELRPSFGFHSGIAAGEIDLNARLQNIAIVAIRKKFSPEFINRIDCVITYQPLTPESLASIVDDQIRGLQSHVNTRLGSRCFTIDVPLETRQWLVKNGTSSEYGARELNRTIHRTLTQPLATMVAMGQIKPSSRVQIDINEDRSALVLRTASMKEVVDPRPTVLLVDDNSELLQFLAEFMAEAKWKFLIAKSASAARRLIKEQTPDAALLDYLLSDGNGVELGMQLRHVVPGMQITIMTGSVLLQEEDATCKEYDFQILRKPFLALDVMNQVRGQLSLSIKRANV